MLCSIPTVAVIARNYACGCMDYQLCAGETLHSVNSINCHIWNFAVRVMMLFFTSMPVYSSGFDKIYYSIREILYDKSD